MKMKEMCQSCGLPLSKDSNGGGTNADGSKSAEFCSYCYQDGKFTYEGSLRNFQEHCRQKMIEGGHNKFTAWLFTRSIGHLKRWKA